ncbi:MAG: CapA family protein [Myxococcales bacterium]|nr:CapA family protein [Myxococcales bacterium]
MLIVVALAVLAAEPRAAEEDKVLRVRAVGDVMLGTAVPEGKLPPDDGAHLLDGVAALLKDADLTFANLEGPLCDSGRSNKCRPGSNCFAFRTPTSYAKHLAAAGVDFGSTANNHSGDFGEGCRRETEAALDANGIAWSGARGTIGKKTVKGRRVALVAFHTSAAVNDVNDLPTAKKLVQQAKADADVVIVSFHGGAEGTNATRVRDGIERYLGENRGDLKAFAHGVIDAGADLVLGHGPHVLRGMELYRGHLIAYSLGNFATYGRFDLSGPLGVSAVLEVRLDEAGRFAGGQLFATKQEGKGVPVVDPSGRGIAMVKELSAKDFPKTGVQVGEDGKLSARELGQR